MRVTKSEPPHVKKHNNWGEPEQAPLSELYTEIWCLSWTVTHHSILRMRTLHYLYNSTCTFSVCWQYTAQYKEKKAFIFYCAESNTIYIKVQI